MASVEELRRFGFSESRIKNWARSGRIIGLFDGVYSYGRDVETVEAAFRAAIAAVGPEAALTGRSACQALGIVGRPGSIPARLEVATNRGRARRLKGRSPALRHAEVRVMKRSYDHGQVRTVNGLPTLDVALSLCDLGQSSSGRDVRFAFLEACRLGLILRPDIRPAYCRIEGRRGAKAVRRLLALWVPELGRIRSVLEGRFLLEWVERDLPMPQVNRKVFGWEVDLYWPEAGVVVELDGAAFHSDPVQRSIDVKKQRVLESHGLTVIRITFSELDRDSHAAVNRVVTALTQAAK